MNDKFSDELSDELTTYDIGDIQDSLVGLRVCENIAISSARMSKEIWLNAMWAVHTILEKKLYRHVTDESGKPVYEYAKDYLRDLDQKCLAGISTMKLYNSALRMAKFYGYGSYDAVAEKGIDIFVKVFQSVETNRQTGEAKNFAPGAIVSAIEELSTKPSETDSNLRPVDVRRELERRFKPQHISIWFDELPAGDTGWYYEGYADDGMLIWGSGTVKISIEGEVSPEFQGDLHQLVISKIKSKLYGR